MSDRTSPAVVLGKPTTYEEAVEKKAEMISRVRCLLVVEATDDEIWARWRAMAAEKPTSAFDVTKALNTVIDPDAEVDGESG